MSNSQRNGWARSSRPPDHGSQHTYNYTVNDNTDHSHQHHNNYGPLNYNQSTNPVPPPGQNQEFGYLPPIHELIQNQQNAPIPQTHRPPPQASHRRLRLAIHQPILPSNNQPHTNPHEQPTNSTPPLYGPNSELDDGNGTIRGLQVGDALNYLDRVKNELYNLPDVYDRFSNLMSDYKAQYINTIEVMYKISDLLRNYPSLVVGFNIFLPNGYKLEMSNNPADRYGIHMTFPENMDIARGNEREFFRSSRFDAIPDQNSRYSNNMAYPYNAVNNNSNSYNQNAGNNYLGDGSQPPLPPVPRPLSQKQPVEFNQAINYVNRIKNIYCEDPDKYKNFLDILQLYQKEQKPIQDIFVMIRGLFGEESELVGEFCHFLPESSRATYMRLVENSLEQSRNLFPPLPPPQISPPKAQNIHQPIRPVSGIPVDGSSYLNGSSHNPVTAFTPHSQVIIPPFIETTNNAPLLEASNPEVLTVLASNHSISPTIVSSKKKKSLLLGDKSAPVKKSKTQKLKSKDITGQTPEEGREMLNEQLRQQTRLIVSPAQIEKFELIRSHIGHLPSYYEFLKTINLYSQGIIECETLIEATSNFIGTSEPLTEWFKTFIGFQVKVEALPNLAMPKPKLDLTKFKACGPSYRQLPKIETEVICSGRDDLCNEVLNNEYVSHPTWASEETVFVAHKKNSFEEALHKSEEDKFELDYNMETNAHTIALLEPVLRVLRKMTPEAAAALKLPPGLGGSSLTIYKRAIRNLYGDEYTEVLELLHDNPAYAVPVVLRRLKQKDQEWRIIKKEWSKFWREIDIKYYYRSLDYQTSSFKYNDRRSIAPRNLIEEIETIKYDSVIDGNDDETPKPEWDRIGNPQVSLTMTDPSLHKDAARLIVCLLENHTGLSLTEKKRIATFIKPLMQNFLDLPFMEDIDPQTVGDSINANDFEENDSSAGSEIDVSSVPKRQTRSKTSRKNESTENFKDDPDMDPDNEQEEHTVDYMSRTSATTAFSRELNVPQPKSAEEKPRTIPKRKIAVEALDLGEIEFKHQSDIGSRVNIDTSSYPSYFKEGENAIIMLCNSHLYALIRLYQIIHCRLQEIKESSIKADKKFKDMSERAIPSRKLDLQPKFEALAETDLLSIGCYAEFLNLTEKVLEGEIDQPVYEDSIRYLFGNYVFNIFTIDRLLNNFCKQANNLLLDQNKYANELTQYFYDLDQNRRGSISVRELYVYHNQLVNILQDENIYFIEYNRQQATINFQMFKPGELTIDSLMDIEKKWVAYINNYSASGPTPGVDKVKRPFLKRALELSKAKKNKCQPVIEEDHKFILCPRSYKLIFKEKGQHGEDVFLRRHKQTDLSRLRAKKLKRFDKVIEQFHSFTKKSKRSPPADDENNFLGWLRGSTPKIKKMNKLKETEEPKQVTEPVIIESNCQKSNDEVDTVDVSVINKDMVEVENVTESKETTDKSKSNSLIKKEIVDDSKVEEVRSTKVKSPPQDTAETNIKAEDSNAEGILPTTVETSTKSLSKSAEDRPKPKLENPKVTGDSEVTINSNKISENLTTTSTLQSPTDTLPK